MKKRLIYIVLSGFALFMASCNKGDDFAGSIEVFDAPKLIGTSPVDLKVKEMYETYNVLFKPKFTLEEYTFNWTAVVRQYGPNETGMRYTPADEAYVVPVIDSVEKWVFNVFPDEFSKKYMPLNILLTDSLGNRYNFAGALVPRLYQGNIATNYIVLSYVSDRFNTEKGKRMLRESWLSLFMEKLLLKFPAPTEFFSVSTVGYAKFSFTNAEDVMTNYAMLKKGRTKQNSGSPTAAWFKTEIGQDFGDFVAFIVYTPEAEKQLAYAKNPGILKKVNLMKAYFMDNFQIELPYRPITN